MSNVFCAPGEQRAAKVKDLFAAILESLKHYPAQRAVADKMRELKLTNVRVINLLGGAMTIHYGEKPV